MEEALKKDKAIEGNKECLKLLNKIEKERVMSYIYAFMHATHLRLILSNYIYNV